MKNEVSKVCKLVKTNSALNFLKKKTTRLATRRVLFLITSILTTQIIWSTAAYLPQLSSSSSLPSGQSFCVSHLQARGIHRRLPSHMNDVAGSHVGVGQLFSSEPSEQSLSPSHFQITGIHSADFCVVFPSSCPHANQLSLQARGS